MKKTDFLPGTPLHLKQRDDMFHFNRDTVALASFVNVRKHDRILDVGTNNGVLLLASLLKGGNEGVGIDIFDAVIELAKENASANDITNARFIVCPLQFYTDKPFDLIICNPPYFKRSTIDSTLNPFLDAAHYENTLPLEMLAQHAFRLLHEKGRLCIVHRAHRLTEIIRILSQAKFALKRIRYIHHDIDKPAVGVLIEAMKNGVETCIVEAPLIISKGVSV